MKPHSKTFATFLHIPQLSLERLNFPLGCHRWAKTKPRCRYRRNPWNLLVCRRPRKSSARHRRPRRPGPSLCDRLLTRRLNSLSNPGSVFFFYGLSFPRSAGLGCTLWTLGFRPARGNVGPARSRRGRRRERSFWGKSRLRFWRPGPSVRGRRFCRTTRRFHGLHVLLASRHPNRLGASRSWTRSRFLWGRN